MQASETKLQEIIEGTKQYIIPLFQRAYSWNKPEWQTLWDDIVELCNRDNPRPHFMGSIVTMPATSIPEGVTKHLLIDGQQRLTTIFILLCALRDKAKESEKELAAEIDNTILLNPYKKDVERYKLQPTQVDREAFHKLIKTDSSTKKGSLTENDISNCYLFFEKKIRQSRLDIEKIQKVVCGHLSLVSVVLSSEDDPYLVFESLNAKGKPLTQADLIRNYLFMKIHTDNQESVYAEYWLPMQELLGDSLTEFIRHYLTKFGKDIKKNEVYFELKDRINQGDPFSYLKDLHKFAGYYAKILNPEQEKEEKIRKYLYRLNRLNISTVYPFLLNCYEDLIQERITKEEFICILQILENFILRRFVCNIQTRGLNRIFALLYSQISTDTNLAYENFVNRLKLTLQHHDYPKDTEFRERLTNVKLYGNNRSEKTRIILESIEESFQHKEKVSFKELSIEHIMPQTLNEWWKNHLGDDWAVTHELFVHSLGNLTLTAYNPELYNQNFIKKKLHFKNSHLELNKYFHYQESWCKEDIESRAKYLAEIALQIWSYFGDGSIKQPKNNSLKGSIPKLLKMFGEEYNVKSWRDVLEHTLNAIADLEPERFKAIMQQYPRLVGLDKKYFRSTRQLNNGAFIEVNLSAQNIYIFCHQAIAIADLSPKQWYVETVNL